MYEYTSRDSISDQKTSLNNFFFFFFDSFIAIVEDKLNSRFYHTRQSQGL